MSTARIGRVRLKNGGAEVRVFYPKLAPNGTAMKGEIVRHARLIGDTEGDMVGFVMVGFFLDGTHRFGCNVDSERCPIPMTLMPAYVGDIVRRYGVTAAAVREVIDEEYAP